MSGAEEGAIRGTNRCVTDFQLGEKASFSGTLTFFRYFVVIRGIFHCGVFAPSFILLCFAPPPRESFFSSPTIWRMG